MYRQFIVQTLDSPLPLPRYAQLRVSMPASPTVDEAEITAFYLAPYIITFMMRDVIRLICPHFDVGAAFPRKS